MSASIKEFESALNSLAKALAESKTDIVRDAVIQRFEFCVELGWKTAKKVMGTAAVAPKVVIREMAAQGLVASPDLWFEFLEARNLSSHTYREDLAEQVYEITKRYLPEGRDLLAKLKKL